MGNLADIYSKEGLVNASSKVVDAIRSYLLGETQYDDIKPNGVKVYRAILSQSGTDAPTAIVLENTLGISPSWARNFAGQYELDVSSLGDMSSKVYIASSNEYSGGPPSFKISRTNYDSNKVYVNMHNSSGSSIELAGTIYFELLVYP